MYCILRSRVVNSWPQVFGESFWMELVTQLSWISTEECMVWCIHKFQYIAFHWGLRTQHYSLCETKSTPWLEQWFTQPEDHSSQHFRRVIWHRDFFFPISRNNNLKTVEKNSIWDNNTRRAFHAFTDYSHKYVSSRTVPSGLVQNSFTNKTLVNHWWPQGCAKELTAAVSPAIAIASARHLSRK